MVNYNVLAFCPAVSVFEFKYTSFSSDLGFFVSLEIQVKFSFDLLQHLNASKKSTVYSPSSLLNVLSMIYVGANNNTAKQIADCIGKDKSYEDIIQYYSRSVKSQNSVRHEEGKNSVQVNVANKMFVQEGLQLLSNYQKIITDNFDNQLQEIDFTDSSVSATEINNFVSKSTKKMINEIITPDDISPETVVAIINAIHFQGLWEKPFDDREKEIFYSNPERQIEMISSYPENGDWNFREGEDWSALGIPYKNRKAWMFIVLPENKDGLVSLIEKLDFKLFQDITTRQKSEKLGVVIPVIDTETCLDLPKYFSKLGIIDAFNDKCDLSKMLNGSHKIGKALHKVVIKVDENGTEASAATIATPKAMSSPGFFNANHPFLYFIVSTEDGEDIKIKDILFIGTFV